MVRRQQHGPGRGNGYGCGARWQVTASCRRRGQHKPRHRRRCEAMSDHITRLTSGFLMESGAFFGSHGTSPWDHPAQAGFSNPANGFLTPESDNNYPEKLSIKLQKTVNFDSSSPLIVPLNIAHRFLCYVRSINDERVRDHCQRGRQFPNRRHRKNTVQVAGDHAGMSEDDTCGRSVV